MACPGCLCFSPIYEPMTQLENYLTTTHAFELQELSPALRPTTNVSSLSSGHFHFPVMCADATDRKWIKHSENEQRPLSLHIHPQQRTFTEHSWRNAEVWHSAADCPQPDACLLSFWCNEIMSPLRVWTITVNECFTASLRNVTDVFYCTARVEEHHS